jgi:Tfp pilus assembly protein PilF
MLTSTIKNRLTLIIVLFSFIACYSQDTGLTEEDLIKKAQTLFDKKDYQEAMPLFAQLVSVHPANPEYNYKFGVCALFGDRSDRRRPIRYLNNALKAMEDDPGLNYHLGLAYYQNQEFTNAMRFFNLYLGKLGPNAPERASILEKINACLNGLILEHTNVIDEIVSRSEFKIDNFHRAYRADEFDGMLVLKPDNFVTAYEKKTGQNSFVFISEPRDVLYFSGYENNSTQKDIFRVTLNEKGQWGKPEKLPDIINTNYDEDFPVATNNGNTLYFSSKGHNSIGGYDIFKTTLDPETNTFSTPENLGVGVNSPFDDILFIPDKTGNFAWFSTDRDNLNGAVSVYKIRLNDKYAEKSKLMAVSLPPAGAQQPDPHAVPETVKKEEPEKKSPQQMAATSEPELTPAERAVRLKLERDMVNKLADTAYMWVTQTRNQIRDLGNRRDRANSVTERKQEAVKTLEVQFEDLMNSLVNTTSAVEFEKQLENAINLKKEIFQYRMRADQANLIAWNLGKQLRAKNEEFERFKTGAGKVQTNSMSGKVEETKIAFLELKSAFNLADTLTDYTSQLMSISSDATFYEIPASELAFASELRKGFETNSLIAQSRQKEALQKKEDIPIVIVDRRTQSVRQDEPEKPSVIAARQVDPVVIDTKEFAATIPDKDKPEISFEIDAVQPVKQVMPVDYKALAITPDFHENDLVINLEFDMPEVIPQVQQVLANIDVKPYNQWDDNVEINFNIDVIEPVALVKRVVPGKYDFIMDEEAPLISSLIDAVQAEPLVAIVDYEADQGNIPVPEEDLNIEVQAEALKILELVKQVNFDENSYELAVSFDDEVEIDPGQKLLEAYKVVEPVEVSLFAFNLPIGEADIQIVIETEEIQAIDAMNTIQIIDIPEGLSKGLILSLEEPEITTVEDPVELIALIQQIETPEMTGLILEEESIQLSVKPEHLPVELVLIDQVDEISYAVSESTLSSIVEDDLMEINFHVDKPEPSALMLTQLSETSTTIEEVDTLTGTRISESDILFLRESVSIAKDIETTRTDMELLKIALTDPDNLEYEELLYAASLETNPKDKIRIYNAAFIHIDRDWRAYNNAGVTSLGVKDLEQAECLLYQASLISDNNGKILNNMGILACLKNDYKAAGDHFIAAGKLGVNAEYNLQILNNMSESSHFSSEQLRREIGEHKYNIDLKLHRR